MSWIINLQLSNYCFRWKDEILELKIIIIPAIFSQVRLMNVLHTLKYAYLSHNNQIMNNSFIYLFNYDVRPDNVYLLLGEYL